MSSNRLVERMTDLWANGGKGLLPYVTAGLPDLPTTRRILEALDDEGATAVELGIPFSDPIADGPVIQESFTRVLERGVRVRDILAMVAEFRRTRRLPILAMLSYSIVYRIGPTRFAEQAAGAGVDGLIIPDISLEEAPEVVGHLRDAGLCAPMLVSPLSSPQRRRRIVALSSGFVYYMSVTGITGERRELPPELIDNVRALRAESGQPVVVGFGISTAEHVRRVCSVADGAIIGSALVRRLMDAQDAGGSADDLVAAARTAVRGWMAGLATVA
jgi:tryptophan synthase alpha chain